MITMSSAKSVVAMPRPLLRAAIIAALAAVLVLVSGCSAIGLVYKQADTLAFRWLDRYADFDDAQSLRVRESIAAWFSWHRRTQLPDYADLLTGVEADVLADTTAGANVGNRVARATRRNASLWTQYRLPQLPGLWVGGGLVHQGDKFTANDNKWRLPGYTVVDLAVGYQFAGGVRLQANLKNAGNRRYYLDGTTTAAGFGSVVPGTPRSLQVSLDYTF